jgi:hypothetical protein
MTAETGQTIIDWCEKDDYEVRGAATSKPREPAPKHVHVDALTVRFEDGRVMGRILAKDDNTDR